MSSRKKLGMPVPYMLSLAAMTLPFSIAATNALLGLSLLFSMIEGSFWTASLLLWKKTRVLLIIVLAYLFMMLLGLLWSPDIDRGIIIISKQWSWLLLPLVFITFTDRTWHNRFLFFLSLGLFLHLLLCIAQSFDVPLPVQAPAGSTAQDPTGLIGHISFGFIYGIWAAWLIQWGWQRFDKWRYLAWAVAGLSTTMVFVAQGRSGYLVTFAVLAFIIWKLWLNRLGWRLLLAMAMTFVVLMAIIMMGPAKQRLQWTTDSIVAFDQGDFQNAEPRWSLWYAAWKGWQQSPLFGVGTGGYPSIAEKIHASKPELSFGGKNPAHPHQMYLLDLVRWGPIGLLLLITLLWQWFKLGNHSDWDKVPHSSMIALSAIGLAVHGLSAPSLEEYYSSTYSVLFLALGLAAMNSKTGDTDE